MSEAKMREEWTYRHAQGVHPGRFTEAEARDAVTRDIERDERRRWDARGKQRLMRRFVTDWEEVPLDDANGDQS